MSAEPNVNILSKTLLFVLSCLLISCAANPEADDQVEQAVDVLYQDALKTAMEGDPEDAAQNLQQRSASTLLQTCNSSTSYGRMVVL